MKSPIVETSAGPVRGEQSEGVVRFLGVPFATPPVGPLRWRRPEPPEVSRTVIDATEFGPAAPQLGTASGLVDRVFRPIRGRSAEDCLYLNLWVSPEALGSGATGSERPVLVWFHGGGFVVGAGSTFLYDGTELARETGALVVTVNYRLGALGFLDLRAVDQRAEATANLGLFDQIAAVEWVRDNAAPFGGDPARITLVGESAGAMSLGCLVAARPGLAPRFVLQSGAADHVSSRDRARAVSSAFLEAAGGSATDLEELRQLDVGAVLRAQRSATLRTVTWGGELPWQPTLDGALLRRPPLEVVEEGKGPLPAVIVGTNRDEWRLFANAGVHLRVQTRSALLRRITRRLGVAADRAEELFELYARRPDGTPRRAFEIWTAIRTDEFFRAPAIDLADRLAARGSRAYVYRFDLPLPAFPRSFGACHAVEVPLLFTTHRHPLLKQLYGSAAETEAAGRVLRERWLAFVRHGVPDLAGSWPSYDASRSTALLSGRFDVVDDPDAEVRRWWQAARARRRAASSRSSGAA